jgi:hypothetical protein
VIETIALTILFINFTHVVISNLMAIIFRFSNTPTLDYVYGQLIENDIVTAKEDDINGYEVISCIVHVRHSATLYQEVLLLLKDGRKVSLFVSGEEDIFKLLIVRLALLKRLKTTKLPDMKPYSLRLFNFS